MLRVCGAEQREVRGARAPADVLSQLPVPGPVVLDLPYPRVASLPVGERPHRKVRA